MKKYFLIVFLFVLSFAYSSNVVLFISKSEKNVDIKITLSNFLSNDIISSLKAGEKVRFSLSIVKSAFLKNKIIKIFKLNIQFDTINNKFRLSRDGKEIFFDSYEQLLKNISVFKVSVKRSDYNSKNLKGIVSIKGIPAVGIFGLIYKIFFNLNYSIVFKIG